MTFISKTDQFQKILVVVMRYVGDSIWTLPYFDVLRNNFPRAEITVVTNQGADAFYRIYPAINRVICYPKTSAKFSAAGLSLFSKFIVLLRQYNPDVVLDLTDSDKSAVFSWFSGAKKRIGYSYYKKWRTRLYTDVIVPSASPHMVEYYLGMLQQLDLSVSCPTRISLPENSEVRTSLLSSYPVLQSKRKKVLIHLGARIELRQWGVEKFLELASLLNGQCELFVVAGPTEQLLLDAFVSNGFTSAICTSGLNLLEFAELCGLSDIFIGNDSGPVHIAATKTFVIGIYGPNTDAAAGPWTDRKLIFECQHVSCRPCYQGGCTNYEYKACLQQISALDVAKAVKNKLYERSY